MARDAILYERLSDNKVRCNMCAHHCVIADGKRGICQVRETRDGTLHTLVYGQAISQLVEQIMRDASRAAEEIGTSIIGGHTGYSLSLSRPLVAVTALGTASGREPVRTGGARVGDHVLVTKGIALEGTAILAHDFADVALEWG
jgi:hypothetical protein